MSEDNGRFQADTDDIEPIGKAVHSEDLTTEMNRSILRAHRRVIEEEATKE